MDDTYEPTMADIDYLNKLDAGYVGLDKPHVSHHVEREDKWSYKRYQAAKRLGLPESELADEPDHLAIDEQGWS